MPMPATVNLLPGSKLLSVFVLSPLVVEFVCVRIEGSEVVVNGVAVIVTCSGLAGFSVMGGDVWDQIVVISGDVGGVDVSSNPGMTVVGDFVDCCVSCNVVGTSISSVGFRLEVISGDVCGVDACLNPAISVVGDSVV